MKKAILLTVGAVITGASLAAAQQPSSAPTEVVRFQVGPIIGSAPAAMASQGDAAPAQKSTEVISTQTEPELVQSEFGVSVPDGPNAFRPGPEQVQENGWLPQIKGPGRFFASAEYLLWWVKDTPLPVPLLTSGTAASQGILASPGTTTLVGDSIGYGPQAGGRFSVGACGEDHDWTIVATAFILETGAHSFTASSDTAGNPVIARPFFNTTTGMQASSLVSFPGSFAGSAAVQSTVDLHGAELNALSRLGSGGASEINFLVGFRYLSLEENLGVTQISTALPGGVLGFNGTSVTAPASIGVTDAFQTRNQFFGGQVGTQLDFHYWRCFLDMTGKLGIGNTYESFNSAGQTTLLVGRAPVASVPGGLSALPGQTLTSRSAFTLVPEFGLNLGIDVTCNFRLFVGYTFLYWDDVIRPGNQINSAVNPSNVPSSLAFGTGGPAASSTPIHNTDFWAQGVNVGFALRY
jgi:hypothetical protein